MEPVRDIFVRDTSALIEFTEPYLSFVELPAFRLDEGGNRFGGKERLRASRTFGQRLEALLGIGIDANGQGCGQMGACVDLCTF